MRQFIIYSVAILLFAVAAAALVGWATAPRSEGGIYALCFCVLTFGSGCALLTMRQ